ncbi:unnamed protein product [Moneuplotes crassus]|uniref:Uncharacterized protein n=1 Tax=Euplotes crassus TaxID=5936 RepID=A0AAD2CYR7_EUPCR|nr:unnamed protein product [Moneuplotes crassus]
MKEFRRSSVDIAFCAKRIPKNLEDKETDKCSQKGFDGTKEPPFKIYFKKKGNRISREVGSMILRTGFKEKIY